MARASGTVHTYRNNTAEPAKSLAWGYPSGVEGFFAELDREVRSLPPDVELVMDIAARHNVRFAPPAVEGGGGAPVPLRGRVADDLRPPLST